MIVHLYRDAAGRVRHVTTLGKRAAGADEPRIADPEASTFEAYEVDDAGGGPAPQLRAREVLDAIEPEGEARWKSGARADLRALQLKRRPAK